MIERLLSVDPPVDPSLSTVGRVGGVFALSIEGLRAHWDPLPFVVMGCLGVVSGFLGLLLPETTGERLPENTEEALNVGKNFKLAPCGMPFKTSRVGAASE